MEIKFQINGREVIAQEDEMLLDVLRRNGIKILTLCHLKGFSPTGACRLCVVEIEGMRDLVTSCSFPVKEGINVFTSTSRVIKARKAIVELLLSNHPDDCLYCCRNGNCEIQWLALEMNVKERKFYGNRHFPNPDQSSTSVYRDPAKCVLCSRCVRVCEEVQLVTAVDFISRGNKTLVNSAFNKGLNISSCINCGACIMVCPGGALTDISHIEKVENELNKEDKSVCAFISPDFVASVVEHFDLKIQNGNAAKGIIAAGLKAIGFDKVFDTSDCVILNINGDAQSLADKVLSNDTSPVISSCCPAWYNFVEEFRPEWMDYLSIQKTPQQLAGYTLKNKHKSLFGDKEIYAVSLTACVANKFEASRIENTKEGVSDIDAVLTVREFISILKTHGVVLAGLAPAELDKPFNNTAGEAYKHGYSGGKAEAVALRLYNQLNTTKSNDFKFQQPKQGNRKETVLNISKKDIGFVWPSGISEAVSYIDELLMSGPAKNYYIEVMACPGGCAGGGGQPVSRNENKIKNRKKICQDFSDLASNKKG